MVPRYRVCKNDTDGGKTQKHARCATNPDCHIYVVNKKKNLHILNRLIFRSNKQKKLASKNTAPTWSSYCEGELTQQCKTIKAA